MNFRQELDTIKQNKIRTPNKHERVVDKILRMILEYYKARTPSEFRCTAREIIFGINCENEITGKMYDMAEKWDRDLSIVEACGSREDAQKVLMLLEEKFVQEEFLTIPASISEKSRVFSVIIVI